MADNPDRKRETEMDTSEQDGGDGAGGEGKERTRSCQVAKLRPQWLRFGMGEGPAGGVGGHHGATDTGAGQVGGVGSQVAGRGGRRFARRCCGHGGVARQGASRARGRTRRQQYGICHITNYVFYA
uniref:Uncharacterized protein n=1 Tax=Branchiostoma floridae TaxID=7739 RepID=C3ZVS0_BRAFL|eukprot:XP_002587324.1 hypothetical protein BRAFLDRAFT_100520 [Branchiostoma floridae]